MLMKTYDDYVQEIQDGLISLSEFVRNTEEDYLEFLNEEQLEDNDISAKIFLDKKEKEFFLSQKINI